MSILQVLYSCHACGIERRPVTVPHRKENEDIVHWVNEVVGYRVKDDHAIKSPHCRAQVCDLMIPIPDRDKPIGSV